MGFGNTRLWQGCTVAPLGDDRYRLETPRDSAKIILEANLDELLERISEEDRGRLVITGGVPQWVLATVLRRFACAFKKLSIHDSRNGTMIEIPNPPADTESAPD